MSASAPTTTLTGVSKFQEYFAFGLITSLFFLWGFSYGLLDVLNKHFQDIFHITKLQSTGIQISYFGAYFIMCLPAGMFMSRFGYKNGIYLGLSAFATGALCFWPSAHFESFPGFVASAFVIASGLATLEVAANSYVTVLGDAKNSAFRLNFAQSFNGLASFVGPLLASKVFFSDGNESNLNSVQYVYLGVALLGVAIMILFFFATLPEISEDTMEAIQTESGVQDDRTLFRRMHTVLGFAVQFAYVGAQVCVGSFVLNYLTDTGKYTSAEGSKLVGYMQITFMVARFVSTPLLRMFDNALLLAFYGFMCTLFSLIAAVTGGTAGLASLFIIFFFEAIIYPTTFSLATSNTGKYTKSAAGILCMGVGGGALFPPIQAAVADKSGTIISFVIPMLGFSTVIFYGLGMKWYQINFAKKLALLQSNEMEPTSSIEKDA